MLKVGDVLDLKPLDTKFFITRTAAETNGASFDMDWELGPNTGGTPVHIHPCATESYEVLEGNLDVYVDGTWHVLPPGQRIVVDASVPHTFPNSSAGVTRVRNSHQPALRYGEYFEGLYRITQSGVISGKRMTLKAILHLAVLMTSHKEEIVSVKPPNLVMRVLGRIGRFVGYQV